MMERRMEDMIHETLKSGGVIMQTKGHDQGLIVTLMSSKGHFGDVFLFHTYLVVSRIEIKFCKVLCTTQFIQKFINDRNEKFVFDCEFVEGMKIKTHAASTFFIEYHEYQRIIGPGSRMDNTGFWKFLNYFLNLIFL
jgi:hypothetical protein